jgi:DNA-binding XRE family transcriptional regulator
MTSAYDAGTPPEIKVRHRLRIAREEASLEQGELADLIGVSRQSISAAESGKSEPRKITLNAWALATGVPVKWLETGFTTHHPKPGGGSSTSVGDLVSERSSVQSGQEAPRKLVMLPSAA